MYVYMSILNDQQKAMIRTQYKPKQKRIEKENMNGFLFDKVSYKEIQENRKNGVKESIIERQFKDLKDQDYLRANQIPEQIIEKDLIDSDSEENNLIEDNESENLIKSDDKNKYSTIKKKQLEIIKEEDEEDKKIDEKNLIDNDSKENNLIDKNKDLLENQLIDSKNSSQNNEQEQSEEKDCDELIKEWLDENNNNKFKEKINHIYSRLIEQEKKFKEYIDEKKIELKK